MKKTAAPEIAQRQRRKEARPSELIAAALELFVERGFAGTKLDDIAARAGVSKGTLYLYFASKEELFKAVIQQGIMPVVNQGEEMLAQHDGDMRSLLCELIYRWWDEVVADTKLAAILKLIVSEAGNFPEVARYFYENVSKRVEDLLGAVLRRGIECGEFRPVDVVSAIDLISAPIMMRSIWQYSMAPFGCGGAKDPEIYLDTYIDMLLNGLLTKEK